MICERMNNKNVGFCHGQCYRCEELSRFLKSKGNIKESNVIKETIKKLPKEYKLL